MHLLLATANPHKVAEMKSIFADLFSHAPNAPKILSLSDLPTPPQGWHEPHESGTTFEANAAIKALSYANQSGHLCLADDSGLEIDALAGRPGVISSHYSTDGRETGLSREQRDAANIQRVLRELQGVPLEQRTARFVCVMTLALPRSTSPLITVRGTFEGRIGLPASEARAVPHAIIPRGTNGFGYDPVFLTDTLQTSAELDPSEKNRLSHRAAAARLFAARLPQALGSVPPA